MSFFLLLLLFITTSEQPTTTSPQQHLQSLQKSLPKNYNKSHFLNLKLIIYRQKWKCRWRKGGRWWYRSTKNQQIIMLAFGFWQEGGEHRREGMFCARNKAFRISRHSRQQGQKRRLRLMKPEVRKRCTNHTIQGSVCMNESGKTIQTKHGLFLFYSVDKIQVSTCFFFLLLLVLFLNNREQKL